jgi:signal transduction histidine kinase
MHWYPGFPAVEPETSPRGRHLAVLLAEYIRVSPVSHNGQVDKRSIANGALTIAVLVAGFVIAVRWPGARHLDWFGAALLCAATLPLAVRERWPVPVLAVNVFASILFHARDFAHVAIAVSTIVALFTVAAEGNRRRTILAGSAVGVIAGVGLWVVPHRAGPSTLAAVGVYGWLMVALVAGEAVRLHRAYIAEVIDRAERAERSRDEEASRQVAKERLRIAHDLHDLLAHSITAIQAQAGVAAHLLAQGLADPAKLASALEAITDACDDARGELSATVGVLRESAESQRGPLPGLDQLQVLAEPAEAAGVTVDFVSAGERRTLPGRVEMVAYRIVQEALTNVAKHSGAKHATVALGYWPNLLELDITDDGNGLGNRSAGGFGIRSMAERAAAIGGQAQAGACPGGFRVAATLPVPEQS